MTIEKIWEYINKNKSQLNKLDILLKLEYFHNGDQYYNESGGQYTFKINNDNYLVGYMYITEDRDDWGQAECYQVFMCYKNEKDYDPNKVYDLLINYNREARNIKINSILD
jgi:hypothetical protein